MFGWRTAGRIAGKNFDLSTGRLAGGKHAEELWPLNRLTEQGTLTGISLRRCRTGRMSVCFDREFEFGVFIMGKWLRIAYFPTSVFPIIPVFPAISRTKNRATFSPRVRTYSFTTLNSPKYISFSHMLLLVRCFTETSS